MTHRRKRRVQVLNITGVRRETEDLVFEAKILECAIPVRLSGKTLHEIMHLIYEASKREEPSALDAMALTRAGEQPAAR